LQDKGRFMSEQNQETPQEPRGSASRRAVLRLGAVAVPAVVTLKPAFAAGNSIMNCEIPMDKWVDAYGQPVAPGTKNAFAPPSRPYLGEEIRNRTRPSISLTNGDTLSQDAYNAHVEYIYKLQRGQPGFTCFHSIRNSQRRV